MYFHFFFLTYYLLFFRYYYRNTNVCSPIFVDIIKLTIVELAVVIYNHCTAGIQIGFSSTQYSVNESSQGIDIPIELKVPTESQELSFTIQFVVNIVTVTAGKPN